KARAMMYLSWLTPYYLERIVCFLEFSLLFRLGGRGSLTRAKRMSKARPPARISNTSHFDP
ncbi:MAG: hypothetical protein ABW003_16165, partial [Microvirga sp.]